MGVGYVSHLINCWINRMNHERVEGNKYKNENGEEYERLHLLRKERGGMISVEDCVNGEEKISKLCDGE